MGQGEGIVGPARAVELPGDGGQLHRLEDLVSRIPLADIAEHLDGAVHVPTTGAVEECFLGGGKREWGSAIDPDETGRGTVRLRRHRQGGAIRKGVLEKGEGVPADEFVERAAMGRFVVASLPDDARDEIVGAKVGVGDLGLD